MTMTLYEKFTTLLKETYPILNTKNIIEDLEKAIEEFGIEIKYSDMFHIKNSPKVNGYSYIKNNKPEIVINGFLSKPQQRFTIAKQLGHILLHWKWFPDQKFQKLPESLIEISFNNPTNIDKRDYQAMQFALEFLSPIQHVTEFLKNTKDLPQDKEFQIALIADYYKIPILQSKCRWESINITNYEKDVHHE